MKKIKKITKGNKTLIHSRGIDWFGLEKDFFEIRIKNKDGSTLIKHFLPPPKEVSNYKRNDPIKLTTDYTDKEYKDMFENEIKNL